MTKKFPTAKALGFNIGDLVATGHMEGVRFVGVIVGEVNTSTPCCEVWGFEQEQGSVYAHQLTKIDTTGFLNAIRETHSLPLLPYNERALAGLEVAGIPAQRRISAEDTSIRS